MWNQLQIDGLIGRMDQDETLDLFMLLWNNYLSDEQKMQFAQRFAAEAEQ